VRAAFWHVLGDALGSVVVILAGLGILLWNWSAADTLGGIAIALLLVWSAFQLVRDSLDILLEGAPRHLDLEEIARKARDLPGVTSIHDLHVWTVSSGFTAMSAHVGLEAGADSDRVRLAVHRLMHEVYAVEHTTIQCEAAPGLLSIGELPSGLGGDLEGCAGSTGRGRGEISRL
jgi:cobalt-zinc-cadmium efflux system protein